jgi:hypothetical protein
MRKDDRSGLIAINSKFGWLLNGPIPRVDVSVNIISSDLTVMSIEARVSEEKCLTDELH